MNNEFAVNEIELKEKIKSLPIEEKIAFLRGKDFWTTYPLPTLNIKSIWLSDGPHGIRKESLTEKDESGLRAKVFPSTCFPTACLTSCSFDEDLLYKLGETIGKECLDQDVQIILGPGINIKRNPLCGRNFEYFSEDPFLTGKLATSFVKGVKSNNVGVCLKHFAVNSEENERCSINEVVDERSLREIYLKAFEMVVKEAKPVSIMASYNRVNGYYACENAHLLTDILRKEWGFDGFVVSDWAAVNNPLDSINAGLNLEMPNSFNVNYFKLLNEYRKGNVSVDVINQRVFEIAKHVLYLQNNQKTRVNYELDHKISKEIAENSIVLLKNSNNILPIRKSDSILLLGEFVKRPRYQGSGSSKIEPLNLTPLLKELGKYSSHYTYLRGYDSNSVLKSRSLINEAVKNAKDKDVIIVFLGLPNEIESEGFDRKNASLPAPQIELINKLYEVNKNIVVVLENGGVIELPFVDKVSAILEAYLGGEAINEAILSTIYGENNPSGRLSETFFKSLKDSYINNYLENNSIDNVHKEGIFVGYRYYLSHPSTILYPFGYGLSYSNFLYKNISIDKSSLEENEDIKISLDVYNDSDFDGKEVVQVYIAKPTKNIFNPKRELKGFKKIFIKAHTSSHVEISIPYSEFAYFDKGLNKWVVEKGVYQIEIGKNSYEIVESYNLLVEGINIENNPPYIRSSVQKYFKVDVDLISDEEYLKMNPEAKFFDEKTDKVVFDENFSINKAIKFKSKGAKLLGFLIKRIPMLKKDSFIYSLAFDAPIRQMRYFVGNFLGNEEVELLVKIISDDHYISNTFKLFKRIIKSAKAIQ